MTDRHPAVIWCFNAGSSSLKAAAFRCTPSSEDPLGEYEYDLQQPGDLNVAFTAATTELRRQEVPEPDAIGHRVVHGGPAHWEPTVVDPVVLRDLEAACLFAPAHQQASLDVVHAATTAFGDLTQVACFDTGFHHELPDVARVLPVSSVTAPEMRKYGFHGLSCESIVSTLGRDLGPRTVIAHLGSGASLTAVRDGRSVDTTMGLTPLGGIPMSTRSGDLDPGVVMHLVRTEGLDADGLQQRIGHESGLLAWSGRSGDMRVLLSSSADDPRAAFAVEAFGYAVRKQIGALGAALQGIDVLVFAGGIGEHSAAVRTRICDGLEYLGIELDVDANQRGAGVISMPDSGCTVRVVASDENRIVARHTAAVLNSR